MDLSWGEIVKSDRDWEAGPHGQVLGLGVGDVRFWTVTYQPGDLGQVS